MKPNRGNRRLGFRSHQEHTKMMIDGNAEGETEAEGGRWREVSPMLRRTREEEESAAYMAAIALSL